MLPGPVGLLGFASLPNGCGHSGLQPNLCVELEVLFGRTETGFAPAPDEQLVNANVGTTITAESSGSRYVAQNEMDGPRPHRCEQKFLPDALEKIQPVQTPQIRAPDIAPTVQGFSFAQPLQHARRCTNGILH